MTTTEVRRYKVTMRKQFPAWDERDGIVSFQHARSKSEAVKYARSDMYRDGHAGGGSGRAFYTAEEVAPEPD